MQENMIYNMCQKNDTGGVWLFHQRTQSGHFEGRRNLARFSLYFKGEVHYFSGTVQYPWVLKCTIRFFCLFLSPWRSGLIQARCYHENSVRFFSLSLFFSCPSFSFLKSLVSLECYERHMPGLLQSPTFQ